MCSLLHDHLSATLHGRCGGQESNQHICSVQVAMKISVPALCRSPLVPFCSKPSLVSVLCSLGPIRDKGELVGPTLLLVPQALQQQLVLLQLALPRQHLGILENRRQMCNLRITDMLPLPQLEKHQHVRSGNVPGFVLSLGKKGRKVKERKACAVPGLTQRINIFLLNYLKGRALWRKEKLREETQLNCSVFSKATGIQTIRP